jgi:hypothetical protein
MFTREDAIVKLPKENAEFERLMRPLCPEEFNQLKENILADGNVIQPLVIWKETGELIDGYHRMKVIKLHPEVKYSVEEMSFPDKAAVVRWVLGHQLGRRNLSGGAIHVARVKLLTSDDERTMKSVAEELNISSKTLQRANEYSQILKDVPEDIREDILKGRRSAGAGAMRKLRDLDAEQKDRAYEKMRKHPGAPVANFLPALKRVAPELRAELEGLSNESVNRISVKAAVTAPADIERFQKLSPIQKQTVDDVIATAGASTLKEAIALVEAPGKRSALPPDVERMNEKIGELFGQLSSAIDELATVRGCSGKSDHTDTIATLTLARSRWSSWSGSFHE